MENNKTKCPKCGYERTGKDDDFISKEECPRCGIIYVRYTEQTENQINTTDKEKKTVEGKEQPPALLIKMKSLVQKVIDLILASASSFKNKKQHLLLLKKFQSLSNVQKVLVLILFLSISVPALIYFGNNFIEGDLNGEIFIVTQGSQNIRLGLVEVRLIPENEAIKYVADKKDKFQQLQKNRKNCSFYIKEAEAKIRDTDYSLADDARESEIIDVNRKFMIAGLRYYSALLKEEIERLFRGLPDSTIKTKTDASGKFSLKMKRGQRMALAANGNTRIIGDVINLYWLIWVSLEGKSSKKIILSNDNLMESDSPESVIRIE